jgi:exopolyphosphatase/guanosine-5'-triphosphate,3'-diphosphate pyrophosphatase
MKWVRVGMIDVGANTLRLLVADSAGDKVVRVHEERAHVGLGEEVERYGRIGDEKAALAVEVAQAQTRKARRLGCERVVALVTSPGRQAANGDEFATAIGRGAGVPARVLTADEEGALAWEGAVAQLERMPGTVAVCDVGGGSTQIVVGTPECGPAWSRSLDVGSRRLTERLLGDEPPSAAAIAAARTEVSRIFRSIAPPMPQLTLATGGAARALRRLTDCPFTPSGLADALEEIGGLTSSKLAKRYGLERERARTVRAGAIILLEVATRLATPLEPAFGGVREGAALALLRESASAYA